MSRNCWKLPCTETRIAQPPKQVYRSRSEQAPGSEFHPRDESENIYCGFLGTSWCNKKVNPETYVPCGSYELLLSNVAHQMKEKLTIQNKFLHFKSQISLKFEICSFFSGSKQQEKQLLREIENHISYRMCLVNENLILVFDVTFS